MNDKFNQDGYFRVTSKDNMPTEPHFAVIEFGSIHIPGDERSRMHPGHGYPAETVSKADYLIFKDREHWELYIKFNRSRPIVPIHSTPATVQTKVEVSVNLPKTSV